MGFRGSRVQIPASRPISRFPLVRARSLLLPYPLFRAVPPAPFLQNAGLLLFAHGSAKSGKEVLGNGKEFEPHAGLTGDRRGAPRRGWLLKKNNSVRQLRTSSRR